MNDLRIDSVIYNETSSKPISINLDNSYKINALEIEKQKELEREQIEKAVSEVISLAVKLDTVFNYIKTDLKTDIKNDIKNNAITLDSLHSLHDSNSADTQTGIKKTHTDIKKLQKGLEILTKKVNECVETQDNILTELEKINNKLQEFELS